MCLKEGGKVAIVGTRRVWHVWSDTQNCWDKTARKSAHPTPYSANEPHARNECLRQTTCAGPDEANNSFHDRQAVCKIPVILAIQPHASAICWNSYPRGLHRVLVQFGSTKASQRA